MLLYSFAPLCHGDTVRTLQRYLRWQPWSPAMPVRGCACAVLKARSGEAALALWLSAGSRQAVGATRQRVLLLALAQPAPPAAQGQCECRAIHPQQHRPKTIYLCFPSTALWVECKQVQPQAGAAQEGGAWSIPLLLAMSQSCHPRDICGEDSAGLSGCSPCFCGPDALQPCTRAWVDGEKVSAQPFSP